MSYRKSIKVLCVVLSIFPLNELSSSVTIHTPEGRDVTAHNFTGNPYFTNEWAQYWIDYYSLDAEIIGNPTVDYNCHGYVWAKTDGIGDYWIQDNNELKFTSDGAYANDSQPSYITCSASVATHAYYEPYSDHSIRVIQNGYPVSSNGSKTHVSKWNDGPLVRHAPRNDVYAAWYEDEEEEPVPIQYFKLKTTHYGTLSNYPKTWVGAGVQLHTLTGNTTLPNNNTLTIKTGATVNLWGYYIDTEGTGVIIRQSGVTINPDKISVKSGSTLKGVFSTIQTAINNASSGQDVRVAFGTYNEDLEMESGVDVRYISGAKPTINGDINFNYVYNTTLEHFFVGDGYTVYVYGSNVTLDGITSRRDEANALEAVNSYADVIDFKSIYGVVKGIYAYDDAELTLDGLNIQSTDYALYEYDCVDMELYGSYFCGNYYDIYKVSSTIYI